MKYAFSIGTFDGVHRGHQVLIQKLRSFGVPTAVVTFPEHPLQVLRPPAPLPIIPLSTKLSLLKSFGIDHTIVLPFADIVAIPFDQFLDSLPISHLVLGSGSAFGHKKLGTEANVRTWAANKNVHVEYIPKLENISSSQIRAAIAAGNLELAQQLLGYPYV